MSNTTKGDGQFTLSTCPPDLQSRIEAFARNSGEHGDMTPCAERVLLRILAGTP